MEVRIEISRLRRDWMKHGKTTDTLGQDRLKRLGRALRESRELVTGIRPFILKMGPIPMLEWLAGDFTRVTGIPCQTHSPTDAPKLADTQIMALFRLSLEALTNVALHAGTSHVAMALENDGNSYLLSVTDAGRGIAKNDLCNPGLGLMSMREQARLLGGVLQVTARPEAGGSVVKLRFEPCR
ncbi:MAG: ATP-binding protein [Pseudomonadota bacterium]